MSDLSEAQRRPFFPALSVLLAAIFFTAALTPSMMPRAPIVLGIVAGASAAVGFEIGIVVRWLWLFLELPWVKFSWQRGLRFACFVAGLAILAYGLFSAEHWQNATRAAVGLDPMASTDPLTIFGVAVLAFVVVWLLFRLFWFILNLIDRLLSKIMPRRVAQAIGVVFVLWLFWALFDGVLGGMVLRAADETFKAADGLVDPAEPRPAAANKVGSEESLVSWDTMGKWGRVFINEAPTREELSEFATGDVMEPVRVYIGLRSAPNAQERADLALKELIRVGGFDRSNLVIVTSTGTGWMDPGAQDTLDFMLGGDVATVVVQYSYLPSALAVFADPNLGIEQARALFDAVYGYWKTLPKDARPKLYLHGLSLGAFTSQEAFPFLDVLGDPIQGALWAGSPFFSPVWADVRRARDPDSPVWKPSFGNGSLVRAMNQDGFEDEDFAPWGPIRLIFLTFGSDPIASFTFDSALRRPEWLGDPRPKDVSDEFRWFPIVTMLQVAMDTAFSTSIQSYGHYYSAPEYIDAWAALLDPPGWNQQRANQLKEIFAARPPAM